MSRLAGVSELLTGTTGIRMAIATVPPGRCSTAHYHVNCESAIYIVSGTGVFLSGPELDKEKSINAGDFIFVPPGANHQPVNTSDTDDLVLIVARNASVEIVVELEGKGVRTADYFGKTRDCGKFTTQSSASSSKICSCGRVTPQYPSRNTRAYSSVG
jgi:uncharacterized RmlC-like cupin family protein